MIINENENELNVNEIIIEKDVARIKENQNFQTKYSKKKKKNMQTIFENCMFKGKHGKGIT